MGTVVKPHDFVNGPEEIIDAAEVNATFDTLYDLVNGNISLENLAASLQQILVPTGTVMQTGRTTAPDGFLLCDGSAVSRTTFADLFAAIGTAYGAGDGSTTFNLPDGRGRVMVGLGQWAGTGPVDSLGDNEGNAVADRAAWHGHAVGHTHTLVHTHTMPHDHPFAATSGAPSAAFNTDVNLDGTTAPRADNTHTHSVSGTTGAASTSTTSEASEQTTSDASSLTSGIEGPAYLVVNHIIKV